MSLMYLEHDEILDEVNRRREMRTARECLGRQALAVTELPRMVKAAVGFLRGAWALGGCALGSHPELQVIHRVTFNLGNGMELSCKVVRCNRCGELVNEYRRRPTGTDLETNRPDGDTSGPSRFVRSRAEGV